MQKVQQVQVRIDVTPDVKSNASKSIYLSSMIPIEDIVSVSSYDDVYQYSSKIAVYNRWSQEKIREVEED